MIMPHFFLNYVRCDGQVGTILEIVAPGIKYSLHERSRDRVDHGALCFLDCLKFAQELDVILSKLTIFAETAVDEFVKFGFCNRRIVSREGLKVNLAVSVSTSIQTEVIDDIHPRCFEGCQHTSINSEINLHIQMRTWSCRVLITYDCLVFSLSARLVRLLETCTERNGVGSRSTSNRESCSEWVSGTSVDSGGG